MKKTLITILTLCLLAAGNSLLAADIKNGKKLQQKNCMSCHDDGMYTRENRFIKKESSLRTQVQRCESTLGLKWFEEEIDDVTAYLNKTFYHFK
ncbi:MAG: cytochrome c [Pseudomonadota bacterium]